MRETWTWVLKFQNPWFKVRQCGALPHFLCHVLNVLNICVNILEDSNTLEHNKTLINLASLRCFSILHRSRESQWILLRTKIRNNKTKNPLRQRVKRMCWMRVRWSVFPLSNAVFVKNSVTGGGDGNTSPGRFSRFHASEASYPCQ